MSNSPAVAPFAAAALSLPVGVAFLSGQIAVKSKAITTQAGRRFLTVVVLPAPDSYTSPGLVELRSTEPLGEAGETFRGKVQVSGYRNNYKTAAGDTIQSARNTLDVVA